MLENEAIKMLEIQKPAYGCKEYQKPLMHAYEMAIKALEEVQQYRAIGTLEECRKSVEICKAMIERGIEPENVEAYIAFEDACVKKGFTIKGLLEAGEKQTIKAPIRLGKCTCPSCGTYNETWKKRRNTVASDIVYCRHCGQAVEVFREDEE